MAQPDLPPRPLNPEEIVAALHELSDEVIQIAITASLFNDITVLGKRMENDPQLCLLGNSLMLIFETPELATYAMANAKNTVIENETLVIHSYWKIKPFDKTLDLFLSGREFTTSYTIIGLLLAQRLLEK